VPDVVIPEKEEIIEHPSGDTSFSIGMEIEMMGMECYLCHFS
jgi:hypothetical protein